MNKNYHLFLSILCIGLGAILLSSCEAFSRGLADSFGGKTVIRNDGPELDLFEPDKAEYVITLHKLVDNPNLGYIVMQVPNAATQESVIIERNPFGHSRDIMDIRLIDSLTRPGFYSLAFRLSPTGRQRWMAMTAECMGQKVAFVVDGEYQKYFTVTQFFNSDNEWYIIEEPFPPNLSKALEKNARKNYRSFHSDPIKDFFNRDKE